MGYRLVSIPHFFAAHRQLSSARNRFDELLVEAGRQLSLVNFDLDYLPGIEHSERTASDSVAVAMGIGNS
jgi:hypothetical protein